MWFHQTISQKKAAVASQLADPLGALAERAAQTWSDPGALDQTLADGIDAIPFCDLLYAFDRIGTQMSADILEGRTDPAWRGKSLAASPVMKSLPWRGFVLSPAYVSRVNGRPCITAVQAVTRDGELLGFLAADFDLHETDLPDIGPAPMQAEQYRGDPSIRGLVFQQTRSSSKMDEHIDDVLRHVGLMFREHGVYHAILHFSSSRAVFWVHDDPYRYRLNSVEDLLDPEVFLVYAPASWPDNAVIRPEQVQPILERFKTLRLLDKNIYLRQASLNVMNGLVGLTFSCDGSHYLEAGDFLAKGLEYWVGAAPAPLPAPVPRPTGSLSGTS